MKTLALRLSAPARIDFASAISVDHLRASLNQAQITLAGRLSPTLDLTASLKNLTPDLARAVAPTLQAAGVLNADARLTGTPAAPAGTRAPDRRRLAPCGTGPAASLPPGHHCRTRAPQRPRCIAGSTRGCRPQAASNRHRTAPLAATGALALRARGNFDVSLLNPVLQADGREARGQAALDISATGNARARRRWPAA